MLCFKITKCDIVKITCLCRVIFNNSISELDGVTEDPGPPALFYKEAQRERRVV